jgi:hypothetical protein
MDYDHSAALTGAEHSPVSEVSGMSACMGVNLIFSKSFYGEQEFQVIINLAFELPEV